MKKYLLAVLGLVIVLPAASFGVTLKIDITPQGIFSKTQTIVIPLSDGATGVARNGVEKPFFRCSSHKNANGITESVFTVDQQFFGLTISATSTNGVTSVKFSNRDLKNVVSSADGLSVAPLVSQSDFETSFSGSSLSIPDGLSNLHIKRVVCTLL